MEVDDEEIFTKKCYKLEQQALDNFNVFYNSSNSMIILWNKYQIFVYEDTEFKCVDKILIPEFHINLLIASNNYLLCLDSNDNVHLTSLKFKNSTQKRLKTGFQPRENGIKTCLKYKEDYVLSLKYDADSYFLCLHRINIDFRLEKKMILLCNNDHWPLGGHCHEKYLLTSHEVTEDSWEHLQKIFKLEDNLKQPCNLLLISFDRFNIYGCIYSEKMAEDEITLVKLYNCPAEICSIQILDSGDNILIGLKMGTVIKLWLCDVLKKTDIVYLNTGLHKMMFLKNSLIYTDGASMWKTENMFSNDIKFTQIFVKNTKDFVRCGEQIVCTTFTKLIYKFLIDDKSAYLIPKSTDGFCSAEKVLNNSEYLTKLFQEIDKNNELVKKLTHEQDCITALSLSNRPDLVNRAIESSVMVFESYDEASKAEFTLTEEEFEYFKENTWLFLIKICNLNIFNTLNDILLHLSENIRVFITLSSADRIKTTSLKLEEPLKSVNVLIPYSNIQTEIYVNVKIVMNIPGAFDKKQSSLVLYRKHETLTSEHFIKTNVRTIQLLKKPKESIDELILKTTLNQYGYSFLFTDISNPKETAKGWMFYVKLPNDYEQIFKSNEYCKKHLSMNKSTYLVQQWDAEEFLKSKSHIILLVCNEKIRVSIQNDGFSNPLLKLEGNNAKMTLQLRNFFANLLYNQYQTYEPGKEFIGYNFYTAAENLQKEVKNCVTGSVRIEDFLPIMDQFEKNIIGALPL